MPEKIVVNGEEIPEASILAEMQYHASSGTPPRDAAADALVIRCLLLQGARRQNIEAQAQEVAPGRFEVEDEAMIREFLESRIKIVPPDDAACRDVYDANPGQYRSPDLFEPRHILYAAKPDDPDAVETALTRARAAIEILTREPQRFAEIAKAESDCTSRDSGGALGQVGRNDTVAEFEAAMRELKPGELAPDPVRTRYGAHVVRMEHRADGRQLPFEAVKAEISSYLVDRQWMREARSLIQALIEEAEIEGWDSSRPPDGLAGPDA